MKSKGILLIVFTLVVAGAGIAYAHWTDTLTVDANASTGSIDVIWQEWGTDDDGLDNTGFYDAANSAADSLTDDGGGAPYDAWGLESSSDPSNMIRCTGGVCNYLGGWITRYDKDVAKCTVEASQDQKGLMVTITDAYPSYHCSVFAQLSNEGVVPVKATAFRLDTPVQGTMMYAGSEWVEATAGTTAWCNEPANAGKCPLGIFDETSGEALLTFDFANGTACDHQLDPYAAEGDMDQQAYWFHIEQAAEQDTTYSFHWEQDFVNWNEWDPSMCTITINGVTFP